MIELEEEELVGVPDRAVNLEHELADHLAVPDSAMALYRQRFSRDWIGKDYPEVGQMLDWVFEYIERFKKAPAPKVVSHEFDIEFEEPVSEVAWLIDEFKLRWKTNRAKDILLSATRKVAADADEAISVALSGLTDVRAQAADRSHEMDHLSMGLAIERYHQRVLAGGFSAPTFGFDEVDRVLMGVKGLVYVIGRPKRYKSWFLLKSAVENQMSDDPRPAVFYSLEMTEKEMFDRYMCMVGNISYSRFMRGILSKDELDILSSAEEQYRDLDTDRQLTFVHPPRNGGERTVSALLAGAREREAQVMYIDQLKFIESSRMVPIDKRHLAIEYINEDLKDASESVAAYVACQFNREAASMTEMADLSKIGLSDSIGQTADMLLGLYQSSDMRQSNLIEFGTIESRNFEHARFLINVDVAEHSDFSFRERVSDF